MPLAHAAEKSAGIVTRGSCRYKEGFAHFPCYNPNAPKGGTLRLSNIDKPFVTLNPFVPGIGICAPGMGLYQYLPFDTLMERSPDEPFALYPRLAKRCELADDRSYIVFYLDERARFHTGDPVTAHDVEATMRALSEHGSPGRRLIAMKVEKMTVIDPHTIRFDFKKQENGYDLELPLIIAGLPVLSAKDLKGKDFKNTGMTPLVGSGPYRVTHIDPGRSITYTRNPAYWGWDVPSIKGLYNPDKIVYTVFLNDIAELEGFKKGLIDFRIETNAQQWSRGYDCPAVRDGKIVRICMPHRHVVGMFGFALNTENPILADIRVRKALNILFCRRLKAIYGPDLELTTSFFQNTDLAASDVVTPEESRLLAELPDAPKDVADPFETFDRLSQKKRKARALALLKEAGWTLDQGVLINTKTRTPLKLVVVFADREEGRYAQSLAKQLGEVGIEIVLKQPDAAQHFEILRQRKADIMVTRWIAGASPGAELRTYWYSALATPPSRNHCAVRSKAVDIACDRAVCAKTPEELAIATRVLDRLLRKNYYVIPLFHQAVDRYAHWKHIGIPAIQPYSSYTPDFRSFWIVPGASAED